MKLQCPTCGESADIAHYAKSQGLAHPMHCWECLCAGRGWVKLELVEFLRPRPKLPASTIPELAEEKLASPTKTTKRNKKAKRKTA